MGIEGWWSNMGMSGTSRKSLQCIDVHWSLFDECVAGTEKHSQIVEFGRRLRAAGYTEG